MAEENDRPSLGALMATSVTAQVVGGAASVVYLAYHHLDATTNGVDPKALEDALTILFSTGFSILAMIGHLIVAFVTRKYLTPKT